MRPVIPFLILLLALAGCNKRNDKPTSSGSSGIGNPALWSGTKQSGASGADTWVYSVTSDIAGSVFVTGATSGNLDGNIKTGISDAFITKYNSLGLKQWTKLLGATGAHTQAYGTAADRSGNVFVSGSTYGNLDGNTLTGNVDSFVTKYDSSGTKQWTRQLGTSGTVQFGVGKGTWGLKVVVDPLGNVWVGGRTVGDLDGNTLSGAGNCDFFITKYDSSGIKKFTRQMGAHMTYFAGVASDPVGNIFVTGYTNGNLDGNTLTGGNDLFITKYDNSGTKQWTRQIGIVGSNLSAQAVAADSTGNAFVTGATGLGLDGNTVTGTSDYFLQKFSSIGTKQ